jgi:ABC-type uncharacterized transport system permease subunit
MNWRRVVVYGVVLWLVPFAVAFVLFGVREGNRALFESLITVTGVVTEVVLALLYFRKVERADLAHGLTLGVAWAIISIIIDLPIFLAIFKMALPDYLADIALTYLCMPAITTGIALAKAQGRA